jgi:CheY-like chemotaxis protein
MEDNLALGLEWLSAFKLDQCEVTLCDNVRDTLNFFETNNYDLLVTDLFVNGEKGGLYLLRQLANLNSNTPPIIAVTGAVIPKGNVSYRNIFLETANRLGATSYIQKPFPAAELVLMAHELWEAKTNED